MRAFYPVRPLDRAVRPLPYPFKGALALSYDIEFTQLPFFEALMSFVNTRGVTPLGQGLGLELTSSMFFFSPPTRTMTYFAGLEARSSFGSDKSRLVEYLQAGLIDTNHAFGDFNGCGGFTRDHALRVYDELGELGVTLPAFTNHGSVDNWQNLGPDAPYHQGDRVGSVPYHADLLAPHGVRYVWTDTARDEPIRPAEGPREWWRWRLERPSRPRSLQYPLQLGDGSTFLGFMRLRGTVSAPPDLTSLPTQIGLIDWESMYRRSGAVLLYQHFGVLSHPPGGEVPSSVEAVRADSNRYLAPFRFLADEHDAGRLWVPSAGRLLRYLEVVGSLGVSTEHDQHGPFISVLGPAWMKPADLAGITFLLNPELSNCEVRLAGHALDVVRHATQEAGYTCASVPFAPLPSVW